MIGHQKSQKIRENTHFHVIFVIFFLTNILNLHGPVHLNMKYPQIEVICRSPLMVIYYREKYTPILRENDQFLAQKTAD